MHIGARNCLGSHDVLFITIDTLRYDVAQQAMQQGKTPVLQAIAPVGFWERRHSPASFTYAAHTAFFAGFLPTPATPGGARAARLFATAFPGSRTTNKQTLVFEEADIVRCFAAAGYWTICVGGVGFFNKQSDLGKILPGYFQESHWSPDFDVTCAQSTEYQVACASARFAEASQAQPVFLFLNLSTCHAPNRGYMPGAQRDSVDIQLAALAYVDSQLSTLFDCVRRHRPLLTVICSDHGEAYGEDGYHGHRLAHPTVWEVPNLQTVSPKRGAND